MRTEETKPCHPERSRGTPLNVGRHATGLESPASPAPRAALRLDFAALRSE
jgi:hypothetical protein